MPAPYVTVIAELTAKPGRENELRELLLALVAEVRKEPGCVQYDMLVNNADPATFIFYENWEDAAALERHGEFEHIKTFRARAPELLNGTTRFYTCTRLA